MLYTKPGFIYFLLAILMCCCYYGIELSYGPINNSAKILLACWIIFTIIITSISFGITQEQDINPTNVSPKYIIFMYSLILGTLSTSSIILYFAS